MRTFLSRGKPKESINPNVDVPNNTPPFTQPSDPMPTLSEQPMNALIKGTNAMRLSHHGSKLSTQRDVVNNGHHGVSSSSKLKKRSSGHPKITMQRNKYYNKNRAESNTNSISTNTQSNQNENSLVNGRYEVSEKLGEGSFGEVRLAIDLKTNREVAIKFEHKSDIKKHLNTEYRVYLKLKDCIGFPAIYWFGRYGDYTALVMDRLGISLKTLYSRCNRIFPVQTVALIGIQLLDRLETLHNAGWLHQDIKVCSRSMLHHASCAIILC